MTRTKLEKQIQYPRETLAGKLNAAGIDAQKALWIALDAGMNLVDREYLTELDIKGEQLKVAECLIKDFYWEN